VPKESCKTKDCPAQTGLDAAPARVTTVDNNSSEVTTAAMSRVYVRANVLTVPHADRDGQRSPVAPDASQALDALRACGWDVVVLADTAGGEVPESVSSSRTSASTPGGGWLLTNAVADASWARRMGLRSALVGPTGSEALLPQRCDFAFRDLKTAALEILAREIATPESAA
jgi:hypothetical protein